METTHRGFLSNMTGSIKGAFIGIILFFASFFVLFINEGVQKDASVIKDATQLSADVVSNESGLVAVTGEVSAPDVITGDEIVSNLEALFLERKVRTYSWVENKIEEQQDNVGGSSTIYTTYEYEKKWVDIVPNTQSFVERKDLKNIPSKYQAKSNEALRVSLGAYSVKDVNFAVLKPLKFNESKIGDVVSNQVFISRDGVSTFNSPEIGDTLVSYKYFPSNVTATLVGRVRGSELVRYNTDGENIFKIYEGDFQSAVSTAKSQDSKRIWLFRAIGFAMMALGLILFLNPLSRLLSILPILGQATGFLIFIIALLISFVLSLVTILVSIIFHNIWFLLISIVITLFIIFRVLKKKRRGRRISQ